MNNRFLYSLFTFFISIELLILIVSFILWILNLNYVYVKVAEFLYTNKNLEYTVIQFALPIGLFGLSFKQFASLLQPDSDLKKFYQWDDYQKLKLTYYIGLTWNALFLIVAFLNAVIFPEMALNIKGLIYSATGLSSIFSSSSIILAGQKLKETLELNKENNKPST